MSKINDRKKLSRGVKLAPEHVFDTLRDVKSVVESVGIDSTQMQKPMAPFAVNLSIPLINANALGGAVCIPFVLPPLQDFFDKEQITTGVHKPSYKKAMPSLLFTGVSFSFDQRNEPAAIASNYWRSNTAASDAKGCYGFSDEQGKLCYDLVDRLNIKLSLIKKEMLFFSGKTTSTAQNYFAENAVWSCLLPSFFFSNPFERLNPFVQSDIDLAIDPYSSYVLKIECPELYDNTQVTSAAQYLKNLALPSVEVSLRFRHELVQKDTGSSITNIPENAATGVNKLGVATASSVSITSPNAGDAIQADDSTHGISVNIHKVDTVFDEKLSGGWAADSDLPMTEQLSSVAGYDVIALPLFGNAPFGGIGASNETFSAQAYVADSAPASSDSAPQYQNYRSLFDRRVMPIHYSYTIHHAILAWNWTPFSPFNTRTGQVSLPTGTTSDTCILPPSNAEFQLEVGIGIGSGLQQDTLGYQQIAHLTLADPCGFRQGDTDQVRGWGEGTTLIDRINSSFPVSRRLKRGDSTTTISLKQSAWNWELHAMRLDYNASGSPGSSPGFFSQDSPIFFGPSRTNSHNRKDTAFSTLAGADQFIEARAALYATTSLNNGKMPDVPVVTVPGGSSVESDHKSGQYLFVGYGGCWVYLICKKHLTGV